jgi:pimeloyl-ACP methyl ester carboxylesterase
LGLLPMLSPLSRWCAYDRANIGRSDPVATPRTVRQMVGDLHELLRAAKVPTPVVLVGKSFGGYPVLMYAATYPTDVAAIVLLDVLLPDFFLGLPRILTAAQMATELEFHAHSSEGVQMLKESAEVRAASVRLPDVPIEVLTVQRPPVDGSWPAAAVALWGEEQRAFADRTGAGYKILDSGHDIQFSHPEEIVTLLRDILASVRG